MTTHLPLAAVSAALTGERLAGSGLFDPARMRVMLDEHVSGQRDWSASIWALQCFDGFLARWGSLRLPHLR